MDTKPLVPTRQPEAHSATVFQQDIFPGQVKAIHLQPSPVETGMLYYCKDGRLIGLSAGSAGQFLTIESGVPVWKTSPYGNMNIDNGNVTVTIGGADTYVQVGSGFTVGMTNDTTFQNSREIKILTAGVYQAIWAISFSSANNNQEGEGTIMIDGVEDEDLSAHAEVINTTKPVTISGSGFVSLVAGNLISLGMSNHTGANNLIVNHATLSILRIG